MLGDNRLSSLDKVILRFIFMSHGILSNKNTDRTTRDIITISVDAILSGNRCIFEKNDSIHLPHPIINHFKGIWVNGVRTSDVFEIVNAIKSKTSRCDINWGVLPTTDMRYSETIYAFRQIEKTLQSDEDTRNLRLSESSMHISIYMSICAILSVLLDAFQLVNPIPVKLSSMDINDSRIDDKTLLEYGFTARAFINYWAYSLHMWVIHEIYSYIPHRRHFYYQFIPTYNVYIVRNSIKSCPKKLKANICRYKLALMVGQIHEFEHDIPDEDDGNDVDE